MQVECTKPPATPVTLETVFYAANIHNARQIANNKIKEYGYTKKGELKVTYYMRDKGINEEPTFYDNKTTSAAVITLPATVDALRTAAKAIPPAKTPSFNDLECLVAVKTKVVVKPYEVKQKAP
jgi:hypothetical protein